MDNFLFTNRARGVFFWTCQQTQPNDELDTESVFGCNTVRVMALLFLILFVPIVWEMTQLCRYHKKVFKKKQIIYYLLLIVNITYMTAVSIVQILLVDFLAAASKYLTYIYVLYTFNRKAKILDSKARIFVCAKIFSVLFCLLGSCTFIYSLIKTPDPSDQFCPEMNDRFILAVELSFSVTFVSILLAGIYLRSKLLREDTLFAQDRITRQMVLRDAKILRNLGIVIVLTELISALIYTYHLIFLPGCGLIPDLEGVSQAIFWAFYCLSTYFLPITVVIRGCWTAKDDNSFASLICQGNSGDLSVIKLKASAVLSSKLSSAENSHLK